MIAHRGLATDAPENTLLAFARATDAGIAHLETDVRATSDGVPVLWHDETLDRVGGISANIADLTLAEVRTVDLGHDQRIATLAEALAAFPRARFNIDIKSMAAAEPTASVIAAAHATDRVLVASFSEARRMRVVRLLPGVATSATALRLTVAVIAARLGATLVSRLVLRSVDAVQMPERVLGITTTTPTMIRRMKSGVREVHVWTINDEAAIRRLFGAGVDGIVTDRADVARRTLAG